ncbi:unnamed protein product [Fusarium graminearum]|uniref:DUF6594 domain-containing protein n=1 Tax=Gibberella zeae TaxID=5518 RepID=A0A9N8R7F6_GIBZA|nr:unnamed protein product [Fusarium graminearum]CAF3603744.1 unnamed protein product [Fusarium graminearum]CAG1969317.1 unnamed protein product [Fusarium graminearum]CAG1970667.1 unnamed protein product [Fusarium graminearum]
MAAPPTLPVVDPSTHAVKPQSRKIEDFREGYPRFTSLISSHDPFFLFRRFGRLRARLLLIKQDKLAVLDITFMWHGQVINSKSPVYTSKLKARGHH